VISSFTGLFISNSFELPSGAVIVLTMTLFFVSALVISTLRKQKLRMEE